MVGAGAPWQNKFEKMNQRSGYLLTSGQWSDCIFMVGSDTNQEVIQAHKLFLAMASPVFEAMFYGGLSERRMVSIPDVEPDAFRDLLRYIYTGNLNIGSFDMACNLWYGAKKYILPHLCIDCSNYIWSVLGPRNACKAYELARLFDEKTLMDVCIQIIRTNTKEILNNGSFKDLEINTVITVFSLEYLNVDSELDLFNALARYTNAGQRKQGQIIFDIEPPSKKLCMGLDPSTSQEKELLLIPESSCQTSPAEEPTDGTENVNKEASIRTALQKIRFLSLSAEQFAEGPAHSDLLTEAESLALLDNITSRDSAVPMPTGFSECREPHRNWVDKEISPDIEAMATFKLRIESRAVLAATKLPTPAEVVRGLMSRDGETLERAARAARLITCPDTEFSSGGLLIQLFLDGGIPPLVAALHHPGTSVRYDAAWALTNFVAHTRCELITLDGAVPALVDLLGRGGVMAEQAAWALGNIAADHRLAVVNAGTDRALLPYMLPTTPAIPLATYLRTYRMLCQNHSCMSPDGILRPVYKRLLSAVPYIENLLVLADEQVLVEACWILRHLAIGAHIKLRLFTHSLAARLTALLRLNAAPEVLDAALAAVNNMLRKPALMDRCIEAGCLDPIINLLHYGNSSIFYATLAAKEILRGTHLHIQQALDKGILDALGLVITKDNDVHYKYHAAEAIHGVCLHGSGSQLEELAEAAAMEPYCRLLADRCFAWRLYPVLDGLTVLLENIEQNTKVALLTRMREIGVPEFLNQISIENYEKNCKERCARAIELLKTYFHDQ